MHWRRWLRVLHRDIGYIAAGLTVIYSISGIAVNHVAEWNPNYIIEKDTVSLNHSIDISNRGEAVKKILAELNIDKKIKNSFMPDPETLQIFLDGSTITIDLAERIAVVESVSSRAVFRETNYLHLNIPKKVWTYVADLFAVSLIFLAVTGLFLIRGKNGIKGRGAWLTAIGLLIPLIFWLIYY